MGAQDAQNVRDCLVTRGFDSATAAVLVESASLPAARVVTGRLGDLATMTRQLGDGPALILIGKSMERARSRRPMPTVETEDTVLSDGRVTAARRRS